MKRLTQAEAERFILANTALTAPPHVPEIRLHLADEAHGLWQRSEEELAAAGLPLPFWAFAWAGGQGLARYVLDHPELVSGRRVLDVATGSGLVAIAAAMAGAAEVAANDIDPFAGAAVNLNTRENNVAVRFRLGDLVGSGESWDVVLAGDIFYEAPMAARLNPWLAALARHGAEVLVGDPGRHYLPQEGLEPLTTYEVPVTRALEDYEIKRTRVFRYP